MGTSTGNAKAGNTTGMVYKGVKHAEDDFPTDTASNYILTTSDRRAEAMGNFEVLLNGHYHSSNLLEANVQGLLNPPGPS